jgi:hypothetical protein
MTRPVHGVPRTRPDRNRLPANQQPRYTTPRALVARVIGKTGWARRQREAAGRLMTAGDTAGRSPVTAVTVLPVTDGGPHGHGLPGTPGRARPAPPVLLGQQVIGVGFDKQLYEHRMHDVSLLPAAASLADGPLLPSPGIRAVRYGRLKPGTTGTSPRPRTWPAAHGLHRVRGSRSRPDTSIRRSQQGPAENRPGLACPVSPKAAEALPAAAAGVPATLPDSSFQAGPRPVGAGLFSNVSDQIGRFCASAVGGLPHRGYAHLIFTAKDHRLGLRRAPARSCDRVARIELRQVRPPTVSTCRLTSVSHWA